jgi:hypothetical protein
LVGPFLMRSRRFSTRSGWSTAPGSSWGGWTPGGGALGPHLAHKTRPRVSRGLPDLGIPPHVEVGPLLGCGALAYPPSHMSRTGADRGCRPARILYSGQSQTLKLKCLTLSANAGCKGAREERVLGSGSSTPRPPAQTSCPDTPPRALPDPQHSFLPCPLISCVCTRCQTLQLLP